MKRFAFVAALLACASVAAADETTLFIPGFDPQALSVDIQGVDAQGRTTYVIAPGVTSGTLEEAGIIGSATLVAGSTDAHLVYIDTLDSVSLSEDCGLNNNLAVCTVVGAAPDTTATMVVTESVSGFIVQGAAPTASSASGTMPTAGSSPASGPSQTDASAAPTNTGTTNNGAGRMETSVILSLGIVGLLSVFLF